MLPTRLNTPTAFSLAVAAARIPPFRRNNLPPEFESTPGTHLDGLADFVPIPLRAKDSDRFERTRFYAAKVVGQAPVLLTSLHGCDSLRTTSSKTFQTNGIKSAISVNYFGKRVAAPPRNHTGDGLVAVKKGLGPPLRLRHQSGY